MNYFNKSLRDLNALQGSRNATGLTRADMAGLGLQIGGAVMQDKASEEERKRQEETDRLALSLRQRSDNRQAALDERQVQQGERGQNMQAFSLLADMAQRARSVAPRYSMRSDFLKAIG